MMATVAVKERPILFSGPMVRAILEGRKTQTRRGDDLLWFQEQYARGFGWLHEGDRARGQMELIG